MKCIQCGSQMEPDALRSLVAEVKGEKVEFTLEVPACPQCGEIRLRGDKLREYHVRASDAFRRQHDLLTSEELRSRQKALGMTLESFAAFVFIGVATLKRWLAGEIQSEALDKLVRMCTDFGELQQSALALTEAMVKGRASKAGTSPASASLPEAARMPKARIAEEENMVVEACNTQLAAAA